MRRLAAIAFPLLVLGACAGNTGGAKGGTSPRVDAGSDAGPDAGPALPNDAGFQLAVGQAQSLAESPSLLGVGDFNGDGRPDVLVLFGAAGSGEHAFQVFLGNGDGTLTQHGAQVDTGRTPRGVAVADFTGDGNLDAAIGVCAEDGGAAAVLLFAGDGKGGFAPAASQAVAVCPFALQALDGPAGPPELVTAGPGPFVTGATAGEVRLFAGGAAGFVPGWSLELDSPALGVAVADLAGDGGLDLAVAEVDGLQIFQGASAGGDGGVIELPAFPPLALDHGPYRVLHAADLDGDGRPDLALSSVATSWVAVLRNSSQGGALALQPAVYQPVGREPTAFVAADLAGDGIAELATANTSALLTGVSVVAVVGDSGDGGLSGANLFTAGSAYGIGAADFNGDGRVDLVITDQATSTLQVLLNEPPAPPAPDAGPFVVGGHTPFPPVPDNGGPVIQNVALVTVTFDGDPQRAADEAYAGWIVGSQWFSEVASEYGPGLGTNQNVHLSMTPPAALQDTDIQTLLADLIADGGLPEPVLTDGGAPNQLYMMYFPAQTAITIAQFGTSCESYCGYHSDTSVFSYAVIPTCPSTTCGPGQYTVSHELVEAATDPFPMTNPAYTSGVLLENGFIGEVADLCVFYSVQEGPYVATRVWSNVAAAAGGQPCVPAPAEPFVAVAPASSSIVQLPPGESLTLTLDAWSTAPTAPFAVGILPFGIGLLSTQFTPTASVDAGFLDNGENTALTLGVPAGAASGDRGVVTIYAGLTDDNFEYWPIVVEAR